MGRSRLNIPFPLHFRSCPFISVWGREQRGIGKDDKSIPFPLFQSQFPVPGLSQFLLQLLLPHQGLGNREGGEWLNTQFPQLFIPCSCPFISVWGRGGEGGDVSIPLSFYSQGGWRYGGGLKLACEQAFPSPAPTRPLLWPRPASFRFPQPRSLFTGYLKYHFLFYSKFLSLHQCRRVECGGIKDGMIIFFPLLLLLVPAPILMCWNGRV